MAYEPRDYRRTIDPAGLVTFRVTVRESDLSISARSPLVTEARSVCRQLRSELDDFAAAMPRFVESFVPVEVPEGAPAIVTDMADAARLAGVGPMAAVAGAMAEHVARRLSEFSDEVIVENGGDCFLISRTDRTAALHAGTSSLSGKVGIVVPADLMPCAICTSSATVGPSVSLGRADAAVVIATRGSIADAAASALGNRVHSAQDIRGALESLSEIEGILGSVVVIGDAFGAWGAARLVPVMGQ